MQQPNSAAARSACAFLIIIISMLLSGKVLPATITPPAVYDNAGNKNEAWGQTFVPQLQNSGYVSGVQI